MKRMIIIISLLIIVLLFVLVNIPKTEYYVYGRIRIAQADLYAEVYTRQSSTDYCIPSLWNGGRALVKADMTGVIIGDMADLVSLDGTRMVLECVCIKPIYHWFSRTHGDVLILNDGLVYRFTLL